MDNKEARIAKRQEKREQKRQQRYDKVVQGSKFKQWRSKRPFWGATLTLLAGLIILYIPLQLYAIALIPGSFVFVGFLFAGLILIVGILAYIYPQFSTVFGIIGMFVSILSIMGALGGFIVGTILGIVGGAFLIAWDKEEVPTSGDNQKKSRKSKKNHKPKKNPKVANTV
ncbi:MAG TPA: DUF6114 domain-containing protein [Pseudogracilibacillus sp.]|nr:DUF6114 domain-containing protein [Pseudogracilibacillus sp.]